MRKVEIYRTFEEQKQAQLRHINLLSPEENMALFAMLMKRARLWKPKQEQDSKPYRKIVIDYDFRLWE